MAIRRLVQSLAFVILGILMFMVIQNVLAYKWVYPADPSEPKNTFREFYDISKDSNIQVLVLGTSHVYCGLDAMSVYRESGITVYELATSAQRIEISRAVLEDALKHTKPEYVFLDASMFFQTGGLRTYYRRALDNMAFGPGKVRLAWIFANRFEEDHLASGFLSAFFPIYEYHDKWRELTQADFSFSEKRNLFNKGSLYTAPLVRAAVTDVATMNAVDVQIASELESAQSAENGKESGKGAKNSTIESREVLAENVDNLLEMKRMCDEAGARLRLFKVPSLYNPRNYSGAWTLSKSRAIKAMSAECGIEFLDLMYDDVGMELDWHADTKDGGKHLNVSGAKKVSDFMTSYLQDTCGLKGEANRHYEADLPIYNQLDSHVRLLSIKDMASYLETLRNMDDICVFFVCHKDMRNNLKPEDMASLSAFGLKTDFENMVDGAAYLAIVDSGEAIYEEMSELKLEKKGTLDDGLTYQLFSGGWYSGRGSMIKLNGKDYSMKHLGINVVVYNKQSQTVLDSLCFDTNKGGEETAIRGNSVAYLKNYSNWRAREDYKQGIR